MQLYLLIPHLAKNARRRPLFVQTLATCNEGRVIGALILVKRGEEGP